ncbi:hypothetical protein HanRHA438_Chr11g0500431 [Helianthus annuus]|nr:hypothetical protein HanRHA438_Chr11g0500431 [Helianthus annuus]
MLLGSSQYFTRVAYDINKYSFLNRTSFQHRNTKGKIKNSYVLFLKEHKLFVCP